MVLHLGEPMERKAVAVFQGSNQAADRLVVLPRAGFRRWFGRKQLAAELATQLLQLIDRRAHRRLSDEANENARLIQFIERAVAAGGAQRARLQSVEPHLDMQGTGQVVHAIAPVSAARLGRTGLRGG